MVMDCKHIKKVKDQFSFTHNSQFQIDINQTGIQGCFEVIHQAASSSNTTFTTYYTIITQS